MKAPTETATAAVTIMQQPKKTNEATVANKEMQLSDGTESVASTCSVTSASSSSSLSATDHSASSSSSSPSTVPATDAAAAPAATRTATPPNRFICPLTLDIMEEPMYTRYGHTFERAALVEWLCLHDGQCPMTRQPLTLSSIIRNHKLEQQIHQWKAAHGIPKKIGPEIPSKFLCAVSEKCMTFPVMTRYGDCMERQIITAWLQAGNAFCPVRGKPLFPRDILPHRALQQEIHAWKVAHDLIELRDHDDDDGNDYDCDGNHAGRDYRAPENASYGFVEGDRELSEKLIAAAMAAASADHQASSANRGSAQSRRPRRSNNDAASTTTTTAAATATRTRRSDNNKTKNNKSSSTTTTQSATKKQGSKTMRSLASRIFTKK